MITYKKNKNSKPIFMDVTKILLSLHNLNQVNAD